VYTGYPQIIFKDIMKILFKLLAVSAMVIGLSGFSSAQDSNVFVAGTYTHNGSLPTSVKGALGTLESGTNIGGIELGASSKVAGPLGLALDLGFSHNGTQNQFLFLAGPELSARLKQHRLFIHALVGGAYETQKLAGFTATALADSSFAYSLGGGAERYFGKHVGLRGALDYVYTEAFHGSENNLRASAGFVVRF
jgi:hypothetical protein